LLKEEGRGKKEQRLLVTRQSLVTQIRRLCLQFSGFPSEVEPLNIGSQAEPGNQLIAYFFNLK